MELNEEDDKRLAKITKYYGVQFETEAVRIALNLAAKNIEDKEVKRS